MKNTYLNLKSAVLAIGTTLLAGNSIGQCTTSPNDGGCGFDHTQTMTKTGYRLVYTNPNTTVSTQSVCTFTVPQWVTNVSVYVWGAGGGGGGANARGGATNFDTCSGGGGGGGGGYSQKSFTVSGGQVYTVTVGGGGSGHNGTNSGTAGSGTESSVVGHSHNVRATGGSGGNTIRSNTSSHGNTYLGGDGGVGGTGSGGDINRTGGNGSNGTTGTHDRSGAGGSGAGSGGNGNNGSFVNSSTPGNGDNTGAGAAVSCHGGSGGHRRYWGSNNFQKRDGNSGNVYGGGGGGALIHTNNRGMDSGNGETQAGGRGANGLVIIEFPFPLAVTLSNFNTSCENGRTINWSTESERNASHFIVERSRDGANWFEVGRQDAAGTTTKTQYYSLEDITIFHEIVYYRLKQVDFDGKSEIFGIVPSDCSSNSGMIVYPNPAQGNFVLEINSETAFEGTAVVYDLNGKALIQREINASKGISLVYFDSNNLANGTYIVKIEGESKGEFQPIKLVVN